jgi:transcription termination factor Rho
VTETNEPTSTAPKKRSGGLSTMLVADLKAMAGGLGISGAGSMKKPQLVEAIKAAQSGGQSGGQASRQKSAPPAEPAPAPAADERPERQPEAQTSAQTGDQPGDQPGGQSGGSKKGRKKDKGQRQAQPEQAEKPAETRSEEPREERRQQDQNRQQDQSRNQNQQGQQPQQGQADAEGGSRRNRRRRGRDRDRTPGTQGGQSGQGPQGGQPQGQQGGGQQGRSPRNEPDTTILDDDVLVPAAGILDVLDNYAFVRTSGYLPGTEDVYVSLSMVRKYGLRRGDAIVGQVRQPREGERREKFNPMVRIDAVNGADPDSSKHRLEFEKLTPLYPTERLRLETGPDNLIGRVIDIAAPIGKGQRGLIVSPAKAGKTMILKSIASSITQNNPECHLMVVLVDERPEEVTDFERSVKGEVIASTFDHPPVDHTGVAELAIERAKRLVELGHDVVVLLDGITRLGRAYNLANPASGRILSGGVDSAALYPPKRFFGAARNIENGGSLTILATALIESDSRMDEVIFEEFKGTGNMEIRLRRELADKRLFPAIDAVQSSTRREEMLMGNEELEIVWKLRRTLSDLEPEAALELLLGRLRKSQTNIEFLRQVQQTGLK